MGKAGVAVRATRLSESFVGVYRRRGDPFASLLARATYLTHYCREGESWTDTVRRVVEGNAAVGPAVTSDEAEQLFHLIWTMQVLPSGRNLWIGGVKGVPADARYNCWYTTLRSLDDWCFTLDQLLLGGGVGVGLARVHELPKVAERPCSLALVCHPEHPNYDEVAAECGPANDTARGPALAIEDSRGGWVAALRAVLDGAWQGSDVRLELSALRARGAPIRTLGGVACGPAPLARMLRSVFQVVRRAAGRKLTSIECLDITNYVGLGVKAGNVRRSALMVLGEADDAAFRRAKSDWDAVRTHRHTSNNSIVFRTAADLAALDVQQLAQENAHFGEPGIVNLGLVQRTDPGAQGMNPCGEQALHDRESCNLIEVFPARFSRSTDARRAFRLATRYALRQRLAPVLDVEARAVAERNMRIGVALGGIEDFAWTPSWLREHAALVRREADDYARELGVNRPLTVTTVKPSGTISLLNGSSPGLHAPFAPHYLRRVRIAEAAPIAVALREAGVPCEPDVYDSSGQTLVFEFPMVAPRSAHYAVHERVRSQFERQVIVQQHWADNAVSATLTYDPERELCELAACLRTYLPHLKSTSCLPRVHGYPQAPYEAIERAEYRERLRTLHAEHPLARDRELDLAECASGACPVR